MPPEVPLTVSVEVPVVAVEEAVSVRVDLALPPEGGVTGLAEKAAVTPLGSPRTLRVVAELNPLRLVTVTVELPLEPRLIVRDVGERLRLKSGTAEPALWQVPLPLSVKDAPAIGRKFQL